MAHSGMHCVSWARTGCAACLQLPVHERTGASEVAVGGAAEGGLIGLYGRVHASHDLNHALALLYWCVQEALLHVPGLVIGEKVTEIVARGRHPAVQLVLGRCLL